MLGEKGPRVCKLGFGVLMATFHPCCYYLPMLCNYCTPKLGDVQSGGMKAVLPSLWGFLSGLGRGLPWHHTLQGIRESSKGTVYDHLSDPSEALSSSRLLDSFGTPTGLKQHCLCVWL